MVGEGGGWISNDTRCAKNRDRADAMNGVPAGNVCPHFERYVCMEDAFGRREFLNVSRKTRTLPSPLGKVAREGPEGVPVAPRIPRDEP